VDERFANEARPSGRDQRASKGSSRMAALNFFGMLG